MPIPLYLRDHKKAILDDPQVTLTTIINEAYKRLKPNQHWFEHQLNRKKCLVMLDGLDEISVDADRKQVAAWIQNQIILHPGNRFIITSRPGGYKTSPIANVTTLAIQNLSSDDTGTFIKNWYRINATAKAQGKPSEYDVQQAGDKADELIHVIKTTPNFQEFTANPLLLSLLTIIHYTGKQLPKKRVLLYSQICDVLLQHWREVIGFTGGLTATQKMSILQPLAFEMSINKTEFIEPDKAHEIVSQHLQFIPSAAHRSAEEFLREIKRSSGLLLGDTNIGFYKFTHKTFQEFFTARHIIQSDDPNVKELIKNNVHDAWWHETIKLYCAQCKEGSAIIDYIVTTYPNDVTMLSLAYDCKDEAQHIDQKTSAKLDAILLEGIDSNDKDRRHLAAKILIELRCKSNFIHIDANTGIDQSCITCAEFQLFIDEYPEKSLIPFLVPWHWKGLQFPQGSALQPVTGLIKDSAKYFCTWFAQYRKKYGDRYNYSLPQNTQLNNFPFGQPTNSIFCKHSKSGARYIKQWRSVV